MTVIIRIPGAMKVRNGVAKSILKRAVGDLLPDEIIHRRHVVVHYPFNRKAGNPLEADGIPVGRSVGDVPGDKRSIIFQEYDSDRFPVTQLSRFDLIDHGILPIPR